MKVSAFAFVVAALTAGIAATVVVRSWRGRATTSSADGLGGGRAVTGRRLIGTGDLVRAAIAGLLVCVAAIAAGILLIGLDLFGVIHVAYLEAVLGIPLMAAIVLAAAAVDRRRVAPTRTLTVVLVLCLGFGPLGLYMTYVEPNQLDTERVSGIALAGGRGGSQPIRIGVLTDLQAVHVGDHEIEAVDRLLAEHPDVIVLPGDVFQDDEAAFERELPALQAQFRRMDVPGGAFLVDGDTDPPEHLRRLTAGTPVRFLDHEVVHTKVRDRDVTIGGIELAYQSPAAAAVARDLEMPSGESDIRILLTHRPDAVYHLPPGRPRTDLVIAGHTHGGQVAIPFFGPIMTLTDVPRRVAAGGLHDMDGRRIYVGRGVGVERGQAPQMRLFVRPNIGILTVG